MSEHIQPDFYNNSIYNSSKESLWDFLNCRVDHKKRIKFDYTYSTDWFRIGEMESMI